jgi:hypothetical protein
MKLKFKSFVIIFLVIVTSAVFAKKMSAQQQYVSFQVFYDQLSPYGQWVDYPSWGYVWIPDAGSDFVPYSTQGHWILTDYGWTWMSDFVWGWAPFHYGRWDFDNYYGWFWIPDNEWGPAWVSWRRADGYYGWAPMEPGISLSVSFGRGYDSRNDHWIFVRDRDIDRPDINHYYVNRSDHDMIIRRSTIINNTYVDKSRHATYVSGPARADIQKVTGRRVNPVTVEEYNKPGQEFNNNHLRIYRPEVSKDNNLEHRSAPSKVTKLKDINVKTSQPENTNPPQNIRRVEQTKDVRPENPNPPQNIRKVEQTNNVKSQNPNPPKNIKKEQRSNTSKQLQNSKKERVNKSNTEKDNKDNKDKKDNN